MSGTKTLGASRPASAASIRPSAAVPARTVDRITPRQMRDFDARIDRALARAKEVRADLQKIGRK